MIQRIEQLELKVTFLEQANAQLSDVIYQQRQELDALRLQLAGLLDRVEEDRSPATPYSAEQEKPPHY